MRIGYACRLLHLLLRRAVHAEGDVVAERVVEEYRFLVYVSYELPQVVNAEASHVDAVDEHLSFLHVVVARYQIDERRFAAAALSHEGYGLSLLYLEADVAQYPLFAVAEGDMAELYLVAELSYMYGVFGFVYGVLGFQHLIDTLHRSESLGYVVCRLRHILERIDDAVEHDEVIYKCGSGEHLAVKDEYSAHP